MARSCKEYICRDGYSYPKMYSVDSEELKQIKKDSNIAFEMHIAIQAMSNGHILLSSVPKPGYSDPVYEIVVGGGSNRFTELRRHLKRDAKSSIKTPNILSTFELRGFYIKIEQDGIIEFGREGETLPLMTYIDVDPIEIKYFGFAAWSGVEAKFLFDCPITDNNGSEITPDSQEVERQLSASDQLKRQLLLYKYPWMSPKPDMFVKLGIKVTSVKYDPFKTVLYTGMSVVVSWRDESMAWYPEKFNGTKSLKFRQGYIWRPKFYIYNAPDKGMLETKSSELISMSYTGEATLHFQTKISSSCSGSLSKLSKWPRDEYTCLIVLQPWEVHDKISIDLMDQNSSHMKTFANIDDMVQNEWALEMEQYTVTPTVWSDIWDSPGDNRTQQSDRVFINIEIKRRATPYNIVFYTPLLVLVIFVLFSFWSEAMTMSRVWFYAGCSIVISMGLCYIDYLVTCHNLPSILVLYTVVLGGVLLAMMTQVLLMTSFMKKLCESNPIHIIFTWHLLRCIFCLPPVKISINGGYIYQEDEEPSTSRGEDVEEMENDKEANLCKRKELAEVIDRVFFVVYSITFAAMLAAHF